MVYFIRPSREHLIMKSNYRVFMINIGRELGYINTLNNIIIIWRNNSCCSRPVLVTNKLGYM